MFKPHDVFDLSLILWPFACIIFLIIAGMQIIGVITWSNWIIFSPLILAATSAALGLVFSFWRKK